MRERIRFFRLMVLSIVLWANFAHSQQMSPSEVGLKQLVIPYEAEETEMQMMIWYPSSVKAKPIKLGVFPMRVAQNAPIKPGKYGLIVISHGTGGSHLGHRDTAHYLASLGYIVFSVKHPNDNYQDNSSARKEKNWVNRPKHISKALDTILANDEFQPLIDEERIGIIGHSAGGYTALALIGGQPNTANIEAHCANTDDDDIFCGSSIFSRLMGWFSDDEEPKGIIKNTRDARIKAAVLMTPVGVLFSHSNALDNVKVPVLIYRAGKDDVLVYPYHAETIHRQLSEQSRLVVVENAGHYSFIAPFPSSIKYEVGDAADDPKGFNREQFHETLNREIGEFFNEALLQ